MERRDYAKDNSTSLLTPLRVGAIMQVSTSEGTPHVYSPRISFQDPTQVLQYRRVTSIITRIRIARLHQIISPTLLERLVPLLT